jgi:hypothetical protein
MAGPSWPRGHRKASTLAMVSANGRNFYYPANSTSNNDKIFSGRFLFLPQNYKKNPHI